uniref:Uncharacterized protein n=1 Tax=viral metagenome TaxID=1070528 RepID=A0A6M3JLX5_9ZZZZ
MTNEEKDKLMKELLKVRQEIDINYSHPFTFFVEAVHNLSQQMIPVVRQQEALAYKLLEIESKLREVATNED